MRISEDHLLLTIFSNRALLAADRWSREAYFIRFNRAFKPCPSQHPTFVICDLAETLPQKCQAHRSGEGLFKLIDKDP